MVGSERESAGRGAPAAAFWEAVRRAFAEFLAIPTAIIVGFLVLAGLLYALERADLDAIRPLRDVLRSHIFADSRATADLLVTIAGSIVTVASITISLLLLALQQTAASLTAAVFDQFLRRRHNQFFFGFFVGLALYALITLATVNEPFNPVLAASFAFLFMVVALFLLVVLLYTAIDQMRPVEIIEAIHQHTLAARERQRRLLGRTRRTATRPAGASMAPARAARHGYVTHIDLDALARGADRAGDDTEIVLRVSLGSYVSTGDVIGEAHGGTRESARIAAGEVATAVRIERQRDIAADAASGIEELATIGWTSISTSKSNPAPGLLAIRSLRDLLARWADEERSRPADGSAPPVPVVYIDTVPSRLMDAFESLAVVSSESMQHQAFAEVARAFATLFERLPPPLQSRAEEAIRRILPALGDHVLTTELDESLADLTQALAAAGRSGTADALEGARRQLGRTVGRLHSRATRVSPDS